jgi:transcription elongation GreA/GreB family factor
MSRAFVKENDLEHAGIDIPERPVSQLPNYVTPNGHKQLRETIHLIETEIKSIKELEDSPENKQNKMKLERDLRYYLKRFETAILIDTHEQNNKVLFGAHVILIDENDETYKFQIVGEDEADIKQNKLSYVSPLAKELIGSSIGDEVIWQRADGNRVVFIDSINY